MAEHGDAISTARAATVAALAQRLATAPEGPFARPLLALGGEAVADLAAALARNRAADAAAGRALIGPHRSDLIVTHAAKGEPAARGSTGEQKALLIAIILAHAELVAERTGRPPLLLLDEVAAHLDADRRAALFARLAATGSQVWMTGTDTALFDAVGEATRLHIANGVVQA
jgi:DNA replication and repair protein RecF